MNIGVLVSGNGSNLQALIDACQSGFVPGKIVCVLSDKASAYALTRAREAGIAAESLRPRDYADRLAFDRAVDTRLRDYGVEGVCLAGYMRLLSPEFVAGWSDRMLNIHPSLLPSFKGLDAVGQALAAGVKVSGCTVHIVRAEMDSGPIVVQEAVPVQEDDTPDTLAARIHAAEHRCYPLALKALVEGRVVVRGGRAHLASPPHLNTPKLY
jgi:phosphoribosylglycinamide formyltransferase-1